MTRGAGRRRIRWLAACLALSLLGTAGGCGSQLVRLAERGEWAELDRQARAMRGQPRGRAARAWAEALVELGQVEEARALLLRDYRRGGGEDSMLALALLERQLGLRGMAAAHSLRAITLDAGAIARSPAAADICELLRARARAQAALGEALAADLDLRRVALVCPDDVRDEDRELLRSLAGDAGAQARAKRSMTMPRAAEPDAEALAAALEVARTRGPRALAELSASAGIELPPQDVAVLLAAELAGALGPGLASPQRLSSWIGDASQAELVAASEVLPDGVREYMLLRVASVRPSEGFAGEREAWIVAAERALRGEDPREVAKGWRVAASVGNLGSAEFTLQTSLRALVPALTSTGADAGTGAETDAGAGQAQPRLGRGSGWALRVPVDRRTFDLLLTFARLLELRGDVEQGLALRRSVVAAGYQIGLAQVAPLAADEVRRSLAQGRPWQALALAEAVPGPLVDEVLPAVASAIELLAAAGEGLDADDRRVVERVMGAPWLASWAPRLTAARAGSGFGDAGCPALASWRDPEAATRLREVGLDPDASAAALEAAAEQLGAVATGEALTKALETDLALACSAPVIVLLHAGAHELRLASLDERLVHVPELSATLQLQLHAELAAANGAEDRARLLTISAAAESPDPRRVWARAAVAGSSFGAREYTLEALRQVIGHSEGLGDLAARREMVAIRLRDLDGDANLRRGKDSGLDELRRAVADYLAAAPPPRRWALREALLRGLADESRADARAWELLLAVLVDDAVRARHPDAVAALERAAADSGSSGRGSERDATSGAGPGGTASAAGGAVDPAPAAGRSGLGTATPGPQLAALGEAEALCRAPRLEETQGVQEQREPFAANRRQRLVGVATVCPARARSEALAELVASVDGPARARLREVVLAGPLAVVPEAERPGALRVVPALRDQAAVLRVAFGLPVAPLWVVTPAQ